MGRGDRNPPFALWLYVGATVLGFGLSLAPSGVHTSYAWWGLVLWGMLLVAMFHRIDLARRLLILGGLAAAFGGMAVQGPGLDAMATLLAILELIKIGLLLTPAARRFTRREIRPVADAPTPT